MYMLICNQTGEYLLQFTVLDLQIFWLQASLKGFTQYHVIKITLYFVQLRRQIER